MPKGYTREESIERGRKIVQWMKEGRTYVWMAAQLGVTSQRVGVIARRIKARQARMIAMVLIAMLFQPVWGEELKPAIPEKMTYKRLLKITWGKTKTVACHMVPTAQNLADNWAWVKKSTRDLQPYAGTTAGVTGTIFNLNNFKIRGN